MKDIHHAGISSRCLAVIMVTLLCLATFTQRSFADDGTGQMGLDGESAFDAITQEFVDANGGQQSNVAESAAQGTGVEQTQTDTESARATTVPTERPLLSEAKAAAIIDRGGNVLYELNADQEMSPASITKVMTAVVALDANMPLDVDVECVSPYLGAEAQMAGFDNGERISFRDLLRVMLVYSANDAAYNVALHVGGSIQGFADMMNKKAQEIGMTHSHFMNPHGIDEDGHYSSARDLAILSRYALENYPFIGQTVSQHSVEIPIHGEKQVFNSTDELLGTYYGIRGVKTGYAESFTFMGASGRGKANLYTAVLGCTSAAGRFNDTAALMDWAYAKYRDWQLADDSWAVRLQPYALDLGYKTVVSAKADAKGTVWPDSNSATFSSTLVRPGRLLDTNMGCGWTLWKQGEGTIGGSAFSTRPIPVRMSSWPIFSLPLFGSSHTLGRTVGNA